MGYGSPTTVITTVVATLMMAMSSTTLTSAMSILTQTANSRCSVVLNQNQKAALTSLFTPELQTLCRAFSEYGVNKRQKREDGSNGGGSSGGGYSIRIVGGACRDALLLFDDGKNNNAGNNEPSPRIHTSPNNEPIDIDLVTNCPPEIMSSVCESAGLKHKQLQGDHRTQTTFLVWVPSSQDEQESDCVFELSSFRYENHPVDMDTFDDGKNKKDDTEDDTDPWKIDASYRDFTMNAISCSPPTSQGDDSPKLHDYFGGYNDILNQRVAWIGSPTKRMIESPVRCLRYFRFHGEINARGKGISEGDSPSPCYDEGVLKEMATQKSRLKTIPHEAMWKNIKQILSSHNNVIQDELSVMAKYGFLTEILPSSISVDCLHWDIASSVRQRQKCAEVTAALNGGSVPISFEPILTIAALLGWDAEKCETLGKHWLWSNKELQLVSFLCSVLYPSSTIHPENVSENIDEERNTKKDLFTNTISLDECFIRLREEDRLEPMVTPARDALRQVLIAQNAQHDVLQSLDEIQRPIFPVKVKDMLSHAKKENIDPLPVKKEIGEAIRWMRLRWIESGCRVAKHDLLRAWSSYVKKD